jgi:hypothetical protein
MTSNPTDLRELRYEENVRVRGWVIAFLGLLLGGTAGAMTGVAVRNLAGDEPIITGGEAVVFYLTFGFAVLLDVFLLVNFTNLSVTVSNSGVEAGFGVFRKRFSWDQVKSVEVQDYRWMSFGGWGIRYATRGRRAWSQMGVKTGVTFAVDEGGKDRSYFVSSRRPADLASAVRLGIGEPRQAANADETSAPGASTT